MAIHIFKMCYDTDVYWTVHHCDSWRIKKPIWYHLLFYFTSCRLNIFRTLICRSSEACDYAVELPHWSFRSWFAVCWRLGAVGFEWYPGRRLQPGTQFQLHYLLQSADCLRCSVYRCTWRHCLTEVVLEGSC